jgi:ElaB/YqjD/DUF883 family membrane-anchored ribosome-binding protein
MEYHRSDRFDAAMDRHPAEQARRMHPDGADEPDEIRAEIDETRIEISETIDAIQEQLRPEHLKEQAKDLVRDATVGKAQDAVDSATTTAKGAGMAFIETLKKNPLPTALVGIGLGWLLVKGRSDSTRDTPEFRPARGRPSYAYGYGGGTSLPDGQENGASGGVTDRVQDTAGQMAGSVQDTANQMAGTVRDRAGQMADQVQDTAGRLMDNAQATAQQVGGTAQGQFQQMLHENPLMLGGLALAAGLIAGLALPETEQENQLMGEMRDSFMEQAKATAQDAQQKVQQVAQEASRAAQQEAKEQFQTS